MNEFKRNMHVFSLFYKYGLNQNKEKYVWSTKKAFTQFIHG